VREALVRARSKYISLIFHDANRDIRLIGAYEPLLGGNNNVPADDFERASLARALQGQGNTTVKGE